jgi:uncharacterized protein YndB with AHSA1/START domain
MIDTSRDLVISRVIKAKRSAVWKAWSTPEHLKEWWCPKPWTTELRKFDLRPGGAFDTLMHGPNGEESSNPGVFLEVLPQERIAFTTALTEGWRPGSPWLSITAIISMEDVSEGTKYTATVLHADPETSKKHQDLGFEEGWGTCITQLEALAKQLVSAA